MKKLLSQPHPILAAALILLTGLVVGLIHHRWFFPLTFHGDAASMQVLAQTMVDEKSLLPADFSYGNQLVMFRSSPFIALALAIGFTGYSAFIVGSAISVGCWFLLLYYVMRAFTGDGLKAFTVALLFFIPMGKWDSDYILGQQSHLANAVLALSMVAFSYLYAGKKAVSSLWLAALPVFLMSAEAPIRSMLVLMPLVLTLLLFFEPARLRKLMLFLLAAFLLGYLANKVLLRVRPLELSLLDVVKFHSTSEIMANLPWLTGEALASVSALDVLASKHLTLTRLVVYSADLAFLLALCAFAVAQVRKVIRQAGERFHRRPVSHTLDRYDFLAVTAVLGLASTLFAITLLNPDSARHMIWAYALLKVALAFALYGVAATLTRKRGTLALGTLAIALLASLWMAILFRDPNIDAQIAAWNYSPITGKIAEISRKTGIKRIFGGDFWRMMPLNSMIPGMSAGVLLQEGTELMPYDFLSRKSWFTVDGAVLYYLKDLPEDKLIKAKLGAGGGKLMFSSTEGSIWMGPAVWSGAARTMHWKGCELRTAIGEPTPECFMRKKDISLSGPLTFGPYVRLRAGSYNFEMVYASPDASSAAVGDWDVVVSAGGKPRLVYRAPLNGSLGKRMKLGGRITIPPGGDSQTVEIRSFAHPGMMLRIESLQVQRLD